MNAIKSFVVNNATSLTVAGGVVSCAITVRNGYCYYMRKKIDGWEEEFREEEVLRKEFLEKNRNLLQHDKWFYMKCEDDYVERNKTYVEKNFIDIIKLTLF